MPPLGVAATNASLFFPAVLSFGKFTFKGNPSGPSTIENVCSFASLAERRMTSGMYGSPFPFDPITSVPTLLNFDVRCRMR